MKVLWEQKFHDVDLISAHTEYFGFDIYDSKSREIGVIIEKSLVKHQGQILPAARVRMARNGSQFGSAGAFHMFVRNIEMDSYCYTKQQNAFRRWEMKITDSSNASNTSNASNDDFDFKENQCYLSRIGVY